MENINEAKRAELNKLLQKTAGDIANLSGEELQQLRSLVSYEVGQYYHQTKLQYYPKQEMIAALLLEEMHKRRLTRWQMCDRIGIGNEYLSKILSGKIKIGLLSLQRIHRAFDIDANFMLENV